MLRSCLGPSGIVMKPFSGLATLSCVCTFFFSSPSEFNLSLVCSYIHMLKSPALYSIGALLQHLFTVNDLLPNY